MGGDLLSENKFSSRVFCTICFAVCISSPLDLPKGLHTTPTVTSVVQIKQSIFDLSLGKKQLTTSHGFLQNLICAGIEMSNLRIQKTIIIELFRFISL